MFRCCTRVLIAVVLVAFLSAAYNTGTLYPLALPTSEPSSGSFSAWLFSGFKFASNEVCPQNVAAHFGRAATLAWTHSH